MMMAYPYMVLFVLVVLLCTYVFSSGTTGTFGWKDRFKCACRYGSCDPTSGSCPTGCREERYGNGCQLESRCMYDMRGVNYTGSVDEAEDGRKCLHWADHRITRYHFLHGDNPSNFCRNPRKSGGYTQRPWCHVATNGDVDYAYCNITKCDCPVGLYGSNCQLFCHCRNTSEACDGITGDCTSGCADGWTGLDCQKKCDRGKFGRHCKQTCDLCPSGSCDPETGSCDPETGACDSEETLPYPSPLNSSALDQMSTEATKVPTAETVTIATSVSGAAVLTLLVGSIVYCMCKRRRSCMPERNIERVEPAGVNQQANTITVTDGTDINQRDTTCQKRERRKKLRSQTLPNSPPTESFFQPSSLFRSSQDLPRAFSTIGSFDIFGIACDEPGTSQNEECHGAIRNLNDVKYGTDENGRRNADCSRRSKVLLAEEGLGTLQSDCYGAIRNFTDVKDGTDENGRRNEDGSRRSKLSIAEEGIGTLQSDCYGTIRSDVKNNKLDIITRIKEDSAEQHNLETVAEIESHAVSMLHEPECKIGVTIGTDDTDCSSPVITRGGGEGSKRVRITEYLDKSFWT